MQCQSGFASHNCVFIFEEQLVVFTLDRLRAGRPVGKPMAMSSVRRIGLLAAVKKAYHSKKKGKLDRPVDESLKHEQSIL